MSTLLNLVWLLLAGIWLAIGYAVAGPVMCITVIGIPFGVAAFRMTNMVLWPFGRTAVRKPGAGAGSAIGNVKLIPITLTPFGSEIVGNDRLAVVPARPAPPRSPGR